MNYLHQIPDAIYRLILRRFETNPDDAAAIGIIAFWPRKDRRRTRHISFCRVGNGILSSLDQVKDALDAFEKGGTRTSGSRLHRTLGRSAL